MGKKKHQELRKRKVLLRYCKLLCLQYVSLVLLPCYQQGKARIHNFEFCKITVKLGHHFQAKLFNLIKQVATIRINKNRHSSVNYGYIFDEKVIIK